VPDWPTILGDKRIAREADRFIPIQDAAKRFDVGVATLYRWLHKNELTRYSRAGDLRTYLDPDEVETLRAFRRTAPRQRPKRPKT